MNQWKSVGHADPLPTHSHEVLLGICPATGMQLWSVANPRAGPSAASAVWWWRATLLLVATSVGLGLYGFVAFSLGSALVTDDFEGLHVVVGCCRAGGGLVSGTHHLTKLPNIPGV